MFPFWFDTIVANIIVLVSGMFVINKHPKYKIPLSIYLGVFAIEQIIGYSMDIDILKINSLHGSEGISISLLSILLPLSVGFVIDYLYGYLKKI